MQNTNLSKILPLLVNDWSLFINHVSKNMEELMLTYNNNKRRIRDLERIIIKINDVISLSKNKYEDILDYKDLFMYVDNSLEFSFDALNFLKKQNNLDNPAVKSIYERIVNSPKIMEITSEYHSLSIKVQFDKEKIKKLQALSRGTNIDFHLIKELISKSEFNDKTKKNILFYPVVMLSIKQKDKEKKSVDKTANEKKYHDDVLMIHKDFQQQKEKYKDLIIKCFNIREKLSVEEIEMYRNSFNSFNSIEGFDDELKIKICTLYFFKVKRELEKFINGISDYYIDEVSFDDEISYYNEKMREWNEVADYLKKILDSQKKENGQYNVFFALDAFNRLIIDERLLSKENLNSVSTSSLNKESNEDIFHNFVECSDLLKNKIMYLETDKVKLVYLIINDNILILSGTNQLVDDIKFDTMMNLTIYKNIIPIKKQIKLLEEKDINYLDIQNQIIETIINKEMNHNMNEKKL